MNKLFIGLYDWFSERRGGLLLLLAVVTALLVWPVTQLHFEENITSFFGSDERNRKGLFDQLSLKDRILVLIEGDDADTMVEAGDRFCEEIAPLCDEGLLRTISTGADERTLQGGADFIYRYLPIWLEEADYARIDLLLTPQGMAASVDGLYERLTSPMAMVVGDMVRRDPLSLGSHLLRRFERFGSENRYTLYDGHLFTENLGAMLIFLSPAHAMGSTGNNDRLVEALEGAAERVGEEYSVEITSVGGPVVAVHNARRIKHDTALTLTLALVVIITVICCSFRSRRAIPLIIVPPLFGALFALAVISLTQGSISAIAVGAGAVILGIALSYSIHVVSHTNHCSDPREIIRDLSYPLTIGCLTTIGAFVALTFTGSVLLHDLGLFSALALIGTTLFCLVVLPHFLRPKAGAAKSGLLRLIERVNGYPYERNGWLVGGIVVVTVVMLFFYRDASFDSDMTSLGYVPERIARAEQRIDEEFSARSRQIYLVSRSDEQHSLEQVMAKLRHRGEVENYISAADFVIDSTTQHERIARWEAFWATRREATLSLFEQTIERRGFRRGAFPQLAEMLTTQYVPCGYTHDELAEAPLLSDWLNPTDEGLLLVGRITLDGEDKAAVYGAIERESEAAIIDRAYFSARMADEASQDFNFILFVSSLIVFAALYITYGRIELALLTFLPMAISWVIILGLMALLDIRFNIVNIILATFIFGIGDDFSIFIMDGLREEYATDRRMLSTHKTAIFFSAFTTIVGMGVLILAQHPALKSIALVSVLGMAVVVVVAYTLQPFLFRLFISSQTERGGYPYTCVGLLRTAYSFLYFLVGCLVAQGMMVVLMVLPIARRLKKGLFHRFLYGFARLFLKTIPGVKLHKHAIKSFDTPSVVVANHQSFVDILVLLSLSPRVVMVTNSWVWRSPFFGWVVRYADCCHAADGYEALIERLRPRVEEGYSVVIFPEGTRSPDCRIGRFHKGAFLLAERLCLAVRPLVLYGTGQVCSKRQGFYIKAGDLHVTELATQPIAGDLRSEAKRIGALVRAGYAQSEELYGLPTARWMRETLHKNYIYKSPVIEWYIRIKARLDGHYLRWHRLIPRTATITDIGCGYGQLALMLGLASRERQIVGMDYDSEKILLASHCFSRGEQIRFVEADMRTVELPRSDVFLFNDSLHYVSAEQQWQILERCVERLNEGGMLIVRDGDSSQHEQQHRTTLWTEKWSTRILRFNRTDEPLQFVDREWMCRFAASHGLTIEIEPFDTKTSANLYVCRKMTANG